MAFESPLFQSSMELLGHSIEHFVSLKEFDRKLVILHLANSVELILKDMVLDKGISIYKEGRSETISTHEAMKALINSGMIIPGLPKIQLLIDERNALQHRFGSPNELTTIYYMDTVIEFFDHIILIHYNQNIEELLQQFTDRQAYSAFKLRKPKNDSDLSKLMVLARRSALEALFSANEYLEGIINTFISKLSDADKLANEKFFKLMPKYKIVEKFGVEIPEELRMKLEGLRILRNEAAHGKREVKRVDVEEVINTIESFENLIKDKNPLAPPRQFGLLDFLDD